MGVFDDKGNVAQVIDLAKQFKAQGRPLPDAVRFIIQGAVSGKLKGSELEAGRRVLAAFLKTPQKATDSHE